MTAAMLVRTATVRSPNSASEVFAYLGDFANAADWHPEFVESRGLSSGAPTRVGARFHVVLERHGWRTDRTYEVVEAVAGRSIVLRAQTPSGVATESVSVRPDRRGCVVRHRTRIQLRGIRALAGPAIALAARRGDALAGAELRRLLSL